MEFWIVSGALATLVAGFLLMALLRGQAGAAAPAQSHDIAVYRDQLAEIDQDTRRGILDPDEAGRLRTEVKRRILEADRAGRNQRVKGGAARAGTRRIVAGAMVVGVVAVAFGVYLRIGAPGYRDAPLSARFAQAKVLRDTRPAQAEAEAAASAMVGDAAKRVQAKADPQFLAMIDQLRGAVASRPNDLRGHMLLARNEALLGNYKAALAAQDRVIALKGKAADARDLAGRAELLVRAAGGYVSPEAEAALKDVLAADPGNGTARFYLGLLDAQTGRPDRAFNIWRVLLEESPPDAPWVGPIRERIGDLAQLAGVRYTPPGAGAAPLRGPAAADVAAAGQMSTGDRMEMIRGMVGGLAARLSDQGGTPAEWAQLIRAYGVLQEGDKAADAWARAQAAFSDPGAIDIIRAAAQAAGVAP